MDVYNAQNVATNTGTMYMYKDYRLSVNIDINIV